MFVILTEKNKVEAAHWIYGADQAGIEAFASRHLL